MQAIGCGGSKDSARLHQEVSAMSMPRRFVTDEKGEKIAVVLDIKEYERLLEDAADLEAVREYEQAKAAGEKPLPLEQALAEVRRNRR